jgi:phosphoserine phosphatase
LDIGIGSLLDLALFDELSINRLLFDEEGKLTSWDTSACRLTEKGARIKQIAETLHISPKQVAFVGNDFNDVTAAGIAGVTFAFNCQNEELLKAANWVEQTGDMRNLLQHFPPQAPTKK